MQKHLIDPDAVAERDRVLYRSLNTRIAKGAAVVSTVRGDWDYATTVTAYLSVSYDPPTMLVSLYRDSRMAEAIEASGRWTLSVLGGEHEAVADWLASPGNPLHGLLVPVPHFRRAEGSPIIVEGSPAWFEAETVSVQEAATHLLFVGRVVAMGGADMPEAAAEPRQAGPMAPVEDSSLPAVGHGPLIRYGSVYRGLETNDGTTAG